MVVEWLKQDGWEVEYNPGSQQAELELVIPLENGSLAGHPDCFISKGDIQNALIDIKTMNDRAFNMWKRDGTLKSKPQYVEQLHVYAMGCIRNGRNIKTLGIAAVNKNNSEWHIDFFDFDYSKAADIQDKANLIFSLNEPPTDNSPIESWCCSYCEYSHLCELKGTKPKPQQTQQENTADLSVPPDFVVSEAIHNLIMARDMAAQARTIEADAKQVLLAEAKSKGVNSLQADGVTCSIRQKTSTRFDSSSFKNMHPDLAAQFTTQSTTTYFDIKES